MQQSDLINNSVKKAISILDYLINPYSFLLRKEENCREYKKLDIRYVSGIKLTNKKLVYFIRTLLLIISDHTAVIFSWIFIGQIGKLLRNNFIPYEVTKLTNYDWLFTITLINLAIFFSSGLYSTKDKSRRIKDAATACSITYLVFLSVILFFDERIIVSFELLLILFTAWLFTLFTICLERFFIFQGIRHIRNHFVNLRRKVILVGDADDIDIFAKLLEENRDFKVVETLNLSLIYNEANSKINTILDRIYQNILFKKIDEVFICSWEKVPDKSKLFWDLQTSGISWRILPLKQLIPQNNHELADIDGIPSIRYATPTIVGIDFLIKRVFDLVLASLLLVILGIPMISICCAIKLDSPGSVFYKQTRVGLKGKHFQVWKFRTMVANASQLQKELEAKNEVSGGILFKIAEDPRITFVGKYLRRYSLDELPQLFNVLRGEMSLVGPRPLPIRDVEKFAKHHHFRHEVLPGITGLWQVSGRSDTSSDLVFNLDFQYIENWSLALDLKILLRTVWVVLFSKGAY